jgi:hypothetical protein
MRGNTFFEKKSMGGFPTLYFYIDIRLNTTFAGENKLLHVVVSGITLKDMSANKQKVSVSLSPEMLEWLKTEADKETHETGEDVSVSRLVARAVKAMQGKNAASIAGAKIAKLSESSGTGSSTRTKKTSRKAG